MIIELNQEDARALLRDGLVGRLGCIAEGEPYVVPVNYLFDGESVYVHSLPGRKIAALRANPRACLQVDAIKDEYNWRSVIAYGNYEEVTDPDESERILRDLFGRLPHLTPVESKMAHVSARPGMIVFRIRIDKLTGVGESWA